MSETLFEFLGIEITITGISVAAAVIVLSLFLCLWLFGRKKKTGRPIFAGQVMNGIGFGLLPALAVFMAMQSMSTGTGSEVIEPLPHVRWFSADGFFLPGRIETTAAAVCFLLLCVWLIIRKEDLPDNGDLLPVSVCIWAAVRLVTEDFRREPAAFFRYASCGVILACMILWSVRRIKTIHTAGRVAIDLAAVIACITIHTITATGVLTVGSAIGDFAVKTGSSFLALMLTLIAGSDLRRLSRRAETEKKTEQTIKMPTVQG